MSSNVNTTTPFVNRALLLRALSDRGYFANERNGNIYLNNSNDYFFYQNGRYVLNHYDYRRDSIIGELNSSYNRLLEEDRERLRQIEEQRRAAQLRLEAERRERERIEKERIEQQRIKAQRDLYEMSKQNSADDYDLIEAEKRRIAANRKANEASDSSKDDYSNDNNDISIHYESNLSSSLEDLEKEKKIIEERERERIQYVENLKAQVIERCKSKGYKIKEVKKDNKIQLVCVKESI